MMSRNAEGQIKLCGFFSNQERRCTNMRVSHQDGSSKTCLEARTEVLTTGRATVPDPLVENTNDVQNTAEHPEHPVYFGIILL